MAVDGHHHNANGGQPVLPLDSGNSPIHPPASEPGLDHDDDAGEDLSESERLLFEQTLNADGQPKRPMNAFMLFARKRRPQVASQNHTLRTGEISKILSKEWGSMSPTDKRHFQELARRHKDEFTSKYPDYIYKRRPNNTRRKRSRSDHRVSADAPSTSQPPLAGPSTAPGALESAPFATGLHHDPENDEFTEQKPSPGALAMGFHTGGMAGPSQLHALPAHHQQSHQHQHQQPSQHQLHSYGYHPPATTAAPHVPSGPQHSPLSSTSRHVPHLYPAAPTPGPASAASTNYTSTAPSPVSAHGPFSHNPHLHHHPQHQQSQRQHSSLHQNAQYSSHPRESAAHIGSPAHHALSGQVWGEFHSYGRASSSTPHPQPQPPAPVPTEPSSDPSYHHSSYGSMHQHTRQMSQHDVSRLPRVSTSALTSPSDASGGYFATGVGPSHSPTALTSHVNHRLLASSNLAPGVYPPGPADQSGTSSEHSSATHSPVNTPWIRPSDQPTRPFAHSSGSSNPQSVSQTPSPLVPGPGSSYHLPSQEATTHLHQPRVDQSLDVHLPSLHQAVPPRTFGVPSQSTQHGPPLASLQMISSGMVTPMQQQQQQQQQQQHPPQPPPQPQPTQQQQAHQSFDYHHLGLAASAGSLSSTIQQSALSTPYIFDDSWQSRQQHPPAHGRYSRDPQQPPPGSNGY